MSKSAEITPEATGNGKKNLLVMIVVAIVAIGIGAAGTWYTMLSLGYEEASETKEKPTTFVDLDVFTVNLQPEENNQYLQVGLSVKVIESPVIEAISKKMPTIRNRILMLLSSKKATDITSIAGKQQLSQEIVHEIKQSLSEIELRDDVLEVLFTSFVIQ